MIKNISKVITGFLIAGSVMVACKDEFLDERPRGTFSEDVLKSRQGVEGVLIGAYSLLDGIGAGGGWNAAGSNWVFGSVASDEAYKGSDAGDQPPINQIERYETLPTNPYMDPKWVTVYDGVARSNDVLNLLPEAADIPDPEKARIAGEASFLRAHYHFEGKKMWNNLPYIDETTINLGDFNSAKVSNTEDIWPKIEADLQFAMDNLPEIQEQFGRANKWAAAAYLAKVYMFQQKFAEARPLLENIITNGVNSAGTKFALTEQYFDNFTPGKQNNSETVFAVQHSVNDGGQGQNANYGDILNFPYGGGPGGCCGFFQPSLNLVNSYKTDVNGLPMPNTFMDDYIPTDEGIASDKPFTPYEGNLDPRLDWTVGRRGIPYLDWGLHPGAAWIRDQTNGGPYSPKKNVYAQSQEGEYTDGSSWTSGLTANNYNLIRFADVLLWAAEAEVEVGSLEQARAYVNRVRERAANPEGFVQVEVLDAEGNPTGAFEPAANYMISTYDDAWTDQTMARTAVQFERKLELAMEGHRFFDLVRYGHAAETLNAYLAKESEFRQYLQGAEFRKGVNEYYPIPEQQIVLSMKEGQATLKQNPGY
jgi:hypothetical protein